jgi:hypothetical protein
VVISVLEDEIRLKNGYWNVPVQPSAEPPRTWEYYEALADVEDALRKEHHLEVWLVPTLSEEDRQDVCVPDVPYGERRPRVTTKEGVAQLVAEHLRDCHPGGVSLAIVEDQIRMKDDYWYVPVRPSAPPPRNFEYYDMLAGVETELSVKEHVNLRLVPA